MRTSRFSTLPILVAMLMGIASMGLSVYDIHARELGALDVGPWAGKRTELVEVARDASPFILQRLLLKFGDEKGEIATELLAPVAGIKALVQRSADIVKAMGAEQAKLGDAKLTPEQRDGARADFKKLEQLHAQVGEDLAAAKRLADLERQTAPVPDQDQEAARRASGIIITDRTTEDPKKGFKTHKEFLQVVMAHGQGQRMDERLKPLFQAAAGSDEHGVYDAARGGFLVPEGFSPTLLQLQPEDDPIAGRTRPFPMAQPIVRIPARVDKNHTSSVSGGLTVTRRPETVAAGSSRQEYERIAMNATSLFGLSYATEEVMSDSPISFIALLSSGFSQEFGAKAIDERLNGSGVGEPEGIVNSPALVTVAKEMGQAADTINYENVTNMRSRCWGYARAIWLANHDTMPQLMRMVLVVGTGGAPVYQPSAREDAPDLLLGRPIFYTEFCAKVGDLGDIVLGNWFEYLDGTYQPLQSAESMHVRFVEHERAFKFWLRNDGRCWWRAPLTPKKSAQTLSPFVTLAARG